MDKVTLVMLVAEWLKRENFKQFSMVYPRMNDTIAMGYEGSIKYDHYSEGFTTVISIYETQAYMEYDNTYVEASDPEFFAKLKAELLRLEAVHSNCKHQRSLND